MKTQAATALTLDEIAWHWTEPRVQVDALEHQGRTALVCRDDLLDPRINGNKARKLDALAPQWSRGDALVTCGGMQSAHLAAVSALGARLGVRVHALVRGERPATLAGNLAQTVMFAHRVVYLDRDTYAERDGLLERYCEDAGLERAHLIPEGASTVSALYGLIRQVHGLREVLGEAPRVLVVESGTGTTALGLGLGITRLGLPWRVHAVGLFRERRRDDHARAARLLEAWVARHGPQEVSCISWVPGVPERRFGTVRREDILECQRVARATGLLLDPIYTLTAWRHLMELEESAVMIHAGGVQNLGAALVRWPALAP